MKIYPTTPRKKKLLANVTLKPKSLMPAFWLGEYVAQCKRGRGLGCFFMSGYSYRCHAKHGLNETFKGASLLKD